MSQAAFELLHPEVQRAIWAMGWKKLRPIQEQSVHTLLQTDRHLLICAATASGKTEAAFLPIISSLAKAEQTSIRAIYIGPLKALINDQFTRLDTLCRQLDLPVHRWHGDVTATRKQAMRRDPGGILLITPESLESNFINYGAQVPALYRELEFVVIDELHSFIGDVRGVHLLSLLARLRAATGRQPRMIGLSATLGDPDMGARFLAPNEPERVLALQDTASTRQIRYALKAVLRPSKGNTPEEQRRLSPQKTLAFVRQLSAEQLAESTDLDFPAPTRSPRPQEPVSPRDDLDEIAEDLVKHFATSTNLVFVNSRRTGEDLAVRVHDRVKELKWPRDPFTIHHGSIAKDLREETESTLKSGQPTTAICSSTLEMGIDIGSVRAVGQIDPPWSVASLVQRLGRSGRRDNETPIMRLYVREDSPSSRSDLVDLLFPDLLRALALTRLMQQKWLEPGDEERRHLSTLIHQILSCLKQTGGMPADALFNALAVDGPFRKITSTEFGSLLRALAEHELIEQIPTGELILAPKGERLGAGKDFYAAFNSTERFRVRDQNRDIGELPQNVLPPAGHLVVLAGRRWRIDEIDSPSKTVRVSRATGGKLPGFRGTGGEIHTRVVQEMRTVLLSEEVPAFLDTPARHLLAAARHIARTVNLVRSDFVTGSGSVRWFPWVGTRCLRTLAIVFKLHDITCETDPLSLRVPLDTENDFRGLARRILSCPLDPKELGALVVPKTVDKFDEFLPDDLLLTVTSTNRLSIPEALAALNSVARG